MQFYFQQLKLKLLWKEGQKKIAHNIKVRRTKVRQQWQSLSSFLKFFYNLHKSHRHR